MPSYCLPDRKLTAASVAFSTDILNRPPTALVLAEFEVYY